ATLGGTTACSDLPLDFSKDNTDVLEKIATLETQLSTNQSNYEEQIAELGGQITELQNALDGYMAKPEENPNALAANYGAEAYEMVKYIDATAKDRDSIAGDKYQFLQKWIHWNLINAGYTEGKDLTVHNFTWSKYYKNNIDLSETITASSYSTDGKLYARSGRNYVESAEGTYVKADITGSNIVVTKQGKSDKQIIVGAHYDGDGTGDNGSGIALNLITAMNLFNVETEYTIKFVFFDAEEYGLYGSTAYANDMTEEEIANTLYMINMDSLVCGDYCYLYGGVQDDENQTVTETEAYDNAMEVAETLGLEFKSNPWTYENPAPGYDAPDYAAPSTGDWSDHVGFKNVGIKYVYFEATNWDIPGPYAEYDGYGETYLIGMLMNTKNDYLEYIESYFPGRILSHLTQFSTLLNALVTQSEVNF
ncbi:MAG: M28 family peptidase, partial [Clostridia bacterium]|nr:M28 family peptidase [Clostridia bacterium]